MSLADTPQPRDRGSSFEQTRWSLLGAVARDAPEARAALEELCTIYWYPLYAFVRRQGHSAHDAQDLTQGFFVLLLEREDFATVDRGKGRFRSFLLAAMKHYLANQWQRAQALKRGGGRVLLSIDPAVGEQRYREEPADALTAEQLYDQRWALTVLDRVLARLESEMAAAGKAAQFAALKFCLTGERGTLYADLAERLGTSEGALKIAVHRLRERYRQLLRTEIAETLGPAADVDEELRQLFAALSR